MPDPRLQALIDQLPEVYHPIYGYPEAISARQDNEDRVALLAHWVTLLADHIGRPLRVLDLGSAQGYLAFRLADMGHHVTGVDSLPINVAVSRAIQALHPELDVSFVEGDLLEVFDRLDVGTYDVVLAFSVLHHIAHRDGGNVAARFVVDLSAEVPHGLFEMAISREPVFWANALPADPRVTLAGYAFMREIGRTPTHLSDVQRPILFCSQSLALVQGHLEKILSHTDTPHAGGDPSILGMRRYYTLPIGIVKVAARFGANLDEALLADRRIELRREAHALEALERVGLDLPDLIEFAETEGETFLARTMYPGLPLSDTVELLSDTDRRAVTGQVLEALAALEEHGLYHRDLRLWNVVWDRDAAQAHLIDHGSIGASSDDTMWPFDAHFALLTFLGALWGRRWDQTGLDVPRSSHLESAQLGREAATLVAELLVHAQNEFVFRDLSAAWVRICTTEVASPWPPLPLAWEWLTRVELQRDAMMIERDAQTAEHVRVRAALRASEGRVAEREAEYLSQVGHLNDRVARFDMALTRLMADMAGRDAAVARLKVERTERDAELASLRVERDEIETEMQRLYRTVSWKVTAPLRRVRSVSRHLLD